ncbi:MAG: hypothetical protein QM768_22515 [Agriterribacter sp.]
MEKVTTKRIPRAKSYWTTDSLQKELKQFCTDNKNALKKHSLTTLLFKKNRSELYHASQKFGGLQLNKQFDLCLKLRRRNYWTEEKIPEELWFIYNAGNKITDQTLRALKRNDLSGAISSRGSIAYFKKRCGSLKRKRTGAKEQSLKPTKNYSPN